MYLCVCIYITKEPLEKFLLSSALPRTMAEYAEEEEEEKQDLPDESHKYEYFLRNHSVYSQWYLSDFEVDGIKFNCTEKYMMYHKAGKYIFNSA